MPQKIVIAGAHGFMGTRFQQLYREAGDTVVTVGRRDADALWGDTDAITRLLDGADVLVNLAGKSVDCRYTARNKAEIFRSRLETTAELGRAFGSQQLMRRRFAADARHRRHPRRAALVLGVGTTDPRRAALDRYRQGRHSR